MAVWHDLSWPRCISDPPDPRPQLIDRLGQTTPDAR